MWVKQIVTGAFVGACIAVLAAAPVFAQTSSSSNYKVEEVFFGSGGELDAQSASYRAQQSAGALGVGTTSSANYDAEAGFLTINEPYLELFVNNATVDLGTLSTSSTGTGTGSFWVRAYLTGTYSVYTMSQPPTSEGGSVLDAKTVLGAPSVGTEEFGINLVDNTTPNIGTNPTNVPDNTFADGEAAPGYDTPDQFKYNPGDIIARSAATAGNQAVGRTDYTISYMANISGITPAGSYSMVHDIVLVGTF